jgi:hypothetical protein
VVAVPTHEIEPRNAVARQLLKALQLAHIGDEEWLRMFRSATSELSIGQLGSTAVHLAKHPPKGPVIAAVLDSVDRVTWRRQREAGTEPTLWTVPYISGATAEEVQRYKRPAGYQWSDEERRLISDSIFGERRESWIEKHRSLFAPAVLDPAVYGPPPDPNDHTIPTPERRAELLRQLRAKLAHLESIGAGPRKGMSASLGAALAKHGFKPETET